MKVRRQIEMEVDFFKIGDQIKVKLPKEKYTATAIQRRENGMLFLLDQYLDDPMPMNAEGGTEGRYEGSDLRAALQAGEKLLPKKLRKHMVPFENGDLLTILSIQEMFGCDENFDKCEGQIPWMKDRRHRIAFRKGENEWGVAPVGGVGLGLCDCRRQRRCERRRRGQLFWDPPGFRSQSVIAAPCGRGGNR